MKNQQVVIDYWTMIQTSFIYLVLVFFGWIFIRLVHAIFWLPKHLQKNQENLQRLQEYLNKKLENTEKEEKKDAMKNTTDNNLEELKKLTNTDTKDAVSSNNKQRAVVKAADDTDIGVNNEIKKDK